MITHSPPYCVLDGGNGLQALLNVVENVKPKLHIFGHIHQEPGQLTNGGISFVNAASIGNFHTGALYPLEILVDLKLGKVISIKRKSFI